MFLASLAPGSLDPAFIWPSAASSMKAAQRLECSPNSFSVIRGGSSSPEKSQTNRLRVRSLRPPSPSVYANPWIAIDLLCLPVPE